MPEPLDSIPGLFRCGFAIRRAGWVWVAIGVVLAAHREFGLDFAERAARLAEFGAVCVIAGNALQWRAAWRDRGRH